jgi:hypothetical protein
MTVVQASALRIPRYDQCPLYRGELVRHDGILGVSAHAGRQQTDDAHAVADPAAGDLPPGNDREWLSRESPAALTPSQIRVVDARPVHDAVVNTVVAPTSNSRSRGSSAGKTSHLPSHSPPKPPFYRYFADRGERI